MKNIFCAALLLLAGGTVQLAEARGCQPGCNLTVEHLGASTVAAGTFFVANIVVENYISAQPNVGILVQINYPSMLADTAALTVSTTSLVDEFVTIEPGDNAPPNTQLFVGSTLAGGRSFYVAAPSTNLTATGVFRIPLKFTLMDDSPTGMYSFQVFFITGLSTVPITPVSVAIDRDSIRIQGNTVEFRVVQSGANLEANSTTAGEGQTVDAFTLSLADAPATATVTYDVTGTAVLGTDYTALFNLPAGSSGAASMPSLTAGTGQTLQIPAANFTAGAISIPVQINVLRDDFRDPGETIFFTITSVDFDSGAPAAFDSNPNSATLRIIEGVSVNVRAFLEDQIITVGEGATTDAFTLRLTNELDPISTATVTYQVSGTAALSTDYTALFNIPAGSGAASMPSLTAGTGGQTLQIPAANFTNGAISIPVQITVARDDVRDPDETILFTITRVDFDSGHAVTFGSTTNSATLRITEGVSLNVRAFLEDLIMTAAEGATTNAFTLRLANALDPSTATVTYEVTGTATLGTDYTALFNIPAGSGAASTSSLAAGTGQTLQIPAANFTNSAISIPVQIDIARDAAEDPDETIFFTINSIDFDNNSSVTFGGTTNSATLQITDAPYREGISVRIRVFLEGPLR